MPTIRTVPLLTFQWNSNRFGKCGVSINGRPVYNEAGSSAILDTGTTLLVMPTAVSRKIHEAIPGASFDALYGWRMPCDLATTKGHEHGITITLGEHDFLLSAADLVRENAEAGSGLCYSGIASLYWVIRFSIL